LQWLHTCMLFQCRAITREGLEKSDTDRSEAQLALTDLKLLAAAQREIGKLKEVCTLSLQICSCFCYVINLSLTTLNLNTWNAWQHSFCVL
jgi:hypothetical protein